jgi:diguanylate cyclase (GGDEF)-like protein
VNIPCAGRLKAGCSASITPAMAANHDATHFSCSLSAVMIGRLHDFGGEAAVARLLREAESPRSLEYLLDTGNWISYAEAIALWRAGARITRHPQFARAVGEDAGRRLNSSPVAALLRSLGSPEEVYRRIADSSSRFSTLARLEAIEVAPGRATIDSTPVAGFPRDRDHCGWTCGLLTQPTVLFGLAPARIEHTECAALGAPACRYVIEWDPMADDGGSAYADALEYQLAAMRERLAGVFATAADLIGTEDLPGVLARITDRAAVEVRAPRYLLAVRTEAGLHVHHKGFSEPEASALATEIPAMSESCLVVPVRSSRCDYGRLVAMHAPGARFFDHERILLEVYARYAAAALDSATALAEAKRRHEQASALLRLARALASAGASGEVAQRLVDAVPDVVDCDRVCVYLWDGEHIVLRAGGDGEEFSALPRPGGAVDRLVRDPRPDPIFVTPEAGDPGLREVSARLGTKATILVPLISRESFLGLLTVAVRTRPERLDATPDLLDRLSGVAAQATTALENGRLLDQITHQALHDSLTGLANRARLTARVHEAVERDRRPCTLLYIDLDEFKPVNDELGHDVGDQLLIAVGDRLSRCTRSGDVVGRLGGDEFAVVLDPDAPAGPVAARIEEMLAQPFEIDGRSVHVRASIGRASFPDDAGDAAELLRAADAAMFACKRSHRAGA